MPLQTHGYAVQVVVRWSSIQYWTARETYLLPTTAPIVLDSTSHLCCLFHTMVCKPAHRIHVRTHTCSGEEVAISAHLHGPVFTGHAILIHRCCTAHATCMQ